MVCQNCGNSQASGRFCGKCGTELQTGTEKATGAYHQTAATSETSPSDKTVNNQQSNVQVENIKKQSKIYGRFFLNNLKRPALSFNDDSKGFIHAIISILLFAALIPLSLYPMIGAYNNGILRYINISFGAIFFNFVIFVLISILLVSFSLFIINKFFGPEFSFKKIITIYGAHLSPFIVGAGLVFLLMFLKSFTYGGLLLIFVFMFTLIILPLYLISSILTKKASKMDPLYGFGLYVLMISVLFAFATSIFADSLIGNFLDDLFYYF